MRKTFPERFPWLFGSIIGISLLSWFLNMYAPQQGSTIFIGIFLIIATLFCLLQFLIYNVRHVSIICIGGAAYLFLHAIKLADPLYVILLILFLISLELSIRNR